MDDSVLLSTEYILVIDTNYYAYDFASQLTAYCTGITDDEETGKNYADLFYSEMGIEDDENPRGKIAEEKNYFHEYVTHRAEDNYFTPCSVWLNKKYGCNDAGDYAQLTSENYDEYSVPAPFSVGIFFDREPTEDLIQIIKERSEQFFRKKCVEDNKHVVIEGFRLIVHTRFGKELPL